MKRTAIPKMLGALLLEFCLVGICFFLVGTGTGALQGFLGFWGLVWLAAIAASFGGFVAWVLGLVLYYGLFRIRRRALPFVDFCYVVTIAAIVAVVSALPIGYLTDGEGAPLLLLFVPLATLIAALHVAQRQERDALITMGEVVQVVVSFAIIGIGIAFWQETLIPASEREPPLSVGVASLCAVLSGVLGLLLYYGLFQKRLEFMTFCAILGVAFLSGVGSAWLLNHLSDDQLGWFSFLVTLGAAVATSVYLRPKDTKATKETIGSEGEIGTG